MTGTSVEDPCTGPVAFAKGPLMLMSKKAVSAVVDSQLFARDVAQAHALSRGEAKAYKGPGSGRIDDDVQLGYWMSQINDLRVVTFRRYALLVCLRYLDFSARTNRAHRIVVVSAS